jgi:cell filamentation protein
MNQSGNARRQELESRYTAQRIAELRINPVCGSFNAAHLKEINRHIFQDLPELGFADVTPGVFRPAVSPDLDWIKARSLETVSVISFIAYSPMDKAARKRLDEVLKEANPAKLSKLKTAEFTRVIGQLYTEIDYIHPFRDGNSRTLREFTRELAEASGYALEWDRFSLAPAGRDILYIARDLSVNKLSLPHVQHFGIRRDIMLSMDQLGNNRELPDLLRDAVRPSRSIAFERLPEVDALARHPDLAEAFQTVRAAAEYFAAKVPDADAQRKALLAVRMHVQEKLNQGETRNFRRPDTDRSKSQSQEVKSQEVTSPRPEQEPGLER